MKKTVLILLGIIIIALALRLPAVLNTESYWFDEVVSLSIAKLSIPDSYQYLRWENNPPAHYWMLHYWIKIFGESEFMVRLSSVLFSILTLVAVFFLGKRVASKNVGYFAAFLFAISSYQLHLSMDARMYPLLLFCGTLSLYFFWQVLNKGGKFNWLLYILFTALTFYTHLTAGVLFLIQNLYFIYHYSSIQKQKTLLIKWLSSQFVIILLFLPWLISFIATHFNRLDSNAWYLHTSGGGFILFQLPRSFFFLAIEVPTIELITLVVFIVLALASFLKVAKFSFTERILNLRFNFSPASVFFLFIFLVPLFAGFILQIWVSKYYAIASIGCYLILALGLDKIRVHIKYKALLLSILFVFFIPYNLFFIQNYHHEWHKTAAYIEQIASADDKVLLAAFVYKLPFDYYYHGDAEIIGFKPEGLEDDLLLRTVKYNWYAVLTEENMPDIDKIYANKKRAIVINPYVAEQIHNTNIVLDWFVENNWRLVHKEQFGGFVRPTVLIFERPSEIQ